MSARLDYVIVSSEVVISTWTLFVIIKRPFRCGITSIEDARIGWPLEFLLSGVLSNLLFFEVLQLVRRLLDAFWLGIMILKWSCCFWLLLFLGFTFFRVVDELHVL